VPERGALKIMSPFSRCQAAWGGFWSTFHLRRRCRTGLIRLNDVRTQARLCRARTAASALVRPAHKLHGVFDMPPVSGQFEFALCFKVDGVLRSFGNGLRAVRFQQLSRIFMDFDFSHGVMLLSFCARP